MGNATVRLDIPDLDIPETYSRGVSLEFLQMIIARDKIYGRANGNGLKASLTNVETENERCSFAELYKDKVGKSGKKFIGKVQFFVSHAWSYKFLDLVQAIKRFDDSEQGVKGAYYFVDYFAVNQWNPTNDLGSLERLIELSDAVVLVMSPLKKPTPVTRCWCLYEIKAAIKYEKPLHGTVPDDQYAWFRTLVLTGSPQELKNFVVEARTAKASVQSDEDMIKAAIRNEIGFDNLNIQVYKAVLNCVSRLTFTFIEDCKDQPAERVFKEEFLCQLPNWHHEFSVAIKNKEKNLGAQDVFDWEDQKVIEGIMDEDEKKKPKEEEEPQDSKEEKQLDDTFMEIPENIQDSFIWKFCSSTWTMADSLGRLFVQTYVFAIEGDLVDVCPLILRYIGGCNCGKKTLRQALYTTFSAVHVQVCKDCSGNCICEDKVFVCHVCTSKGLKYCTKCNFRHVGDHICK